MRQALLRMTVSGLMLMMCVAVHAATTSQTETDDEHLRWRSQANELFEANRFSEALPIYEQLVAAKPDDLFLLERYGFMLAATINNLDDEQQRQAQRLKARTQLLRAKELGDDSDLLNILLESIGDGTESPFSENEMVDQLMRSAEAAFTRGDMDIARAGYLMALQEDPSLYFAALFIGDTFYKEHKLDLAGEWFQRAIQIDPNQETAYRYWGDALMQTGRMPEAREQYINAIVAEPYSNRSRSGLSKWMQQSKREFKVPHLAPHASVTFDEEHKPAITINTDGLSVNELEFGTWMIYAAIRSTWIEKTFAETYPEESSYRHSLAEESAAYRTALAFALEDKKYKRAVKEKNSQLATLAMLIDTGLLESYILLFQPDQGIAQDYTSYRDQHRDQLRKMLKHVTLSSNETL